MSDTAVIQVAEVKVGATGVTQRGQWTLYVVEDGNGDGYKTFDKALYDSAQKYIGKRAEIDFEIGEKGPKLLAIREAPAQNGDTPPLGTGQYVASQKPPIEDQRISAKTAWNCAVQLVHEELSHNTSREITPALVEERAQHYADHIFMDLLRKGKSMDDSQIPF